MIPHLHLQDTDEPGVLPTIDFPGLRFYQRQGFRTAWIERNALTNGLSFVPAVRIGDFEYRDRVWPDYDLPQ